MEDAVKIAEFADPAECPICGTVTDGFLAAGVKSMIPDRRCPTCTSLERHRAVWLFLQRRTDLFTKKNVRFLDVAPEKSIGPRVAELPNVDYLSADLVSERAMMHFDLTDIPLPDASFDVIFASHVLEHIPDDRKAMRELYRILNPGGWAVLLVPMYGPVTREDVVDDPKERERRYGQTDHVRMYGTDGEYERRLAGAGFEVRIDDLLATLDPKLLHRYRIDPTERIHYCVRAPQPSRRWWRLRR
jgi:SAM-dependent methyltransferase